MAGVPVVADVVDDAPVVADVVDDAPVVAEADADISVKAVKEWDLNKMAEFSNHDDVTIYDNVKIPCIPECGCVDRCSIASIMCINGDIIKSPSHVDTLIKYGFIKLDDCKFLCMVLTHLETIIPKGWSTSVFEHLFYKMDRDALASYRIRYDEEDDYDYSMLDLLYGSTYGHIFGLAWCDYLFRYCGYTRRPNDHNILENVDKPSEVVYFVKKGYNVNHVYTNSFSYNGLNLLMRFISRDVDFDIPAWSSVDDAPPSVRRDSCGYTIWQLFRAYASNGLDLDFTDPKGRTIRDYFAHLKIIPSYDGVSDTGTVQEWFDSYLNDNE